MFDIGIVKYRYIDKYREKSGKTESDIYREFVSGDNIGENEYRDIDLADIAHCIRKVTFILKSVFFF